MEKGPDVKIGLRHRHMTYVRCGEWIEKVKAFFDALAHLFIAF